MTCMRRAAWPCTAPPWWHNVCDEHRDVATTSLIETWIDETERRVWFLFEAGQREMTGGH
jgi:hypothetical protein